MRTDTKKKALNISQAAARGACPVCAALKQEQSDLIEQIGIGEVDVLCNFHAWAFAKSQDGRRTAQIYLSLLKRQPIEEQPRQYCGICERLAAEAGAREAELLAEMERESFREWMVKQGCFCSKHGKEVTKMAPPHLRETVLRIVGRYRNELTEELQGYLEHLELHDRTGGGVLGRAAEFLAAQRGIAR